MSTNPSDHDLTADDLRDAAELLASEAWKPHHRRAADLLDALADAMEVRRDR